jgi:hypothetical protein
LKRELHQLILSNDERTGIDTSIEYESETAGDGRGAPNLPDHLLRNLGISGEAETFIAGKTYPVFFTAKVMPESHVWFTTKPDPRRTIYIFNNQKVLGSVSTIKVHFRLAEETISVAVAFRDPTHTTTLLLYVSIYLRQDEFDRLFRHYYLASERPYLHVVVGLVCYDGPEPFAILIEEGVTVSVDLRSVSSGRIFKSIAPESKEAKPETGIADAPEARAEDRFEQALARLEASQNKLATSLYRFLLAFVLIIGLLLLTRGHFLW